MLKRWVIENFKSFLGRAEFELSPVTVLAGANSTGKSTLIQAILLAKQTIQHGAEQRSVALNGPILRLGRFDDIHNVKSSSSHFGFGGTLSDGDELEETNIAPPWMHRNVPQRSSLSEEMSLYSTFHVNTISMTNEISHLYPELKSCEVTFLSEEKRYDYDLEDDEHDASEQVSYRTIKLHTSTETAGTKLSALNIRERRNRIDDLVKYDIVEIDDETKRSTLSRPDSQILGCGARQFFPGQIAISYDRSAWKAQRIAGYIVRYHVRRLTGEWSEEVVPHEVVDVIREKVKENLDREVVVERYLPRRSGSSYQLHEVLSALRRLSPGPARRPRGLFGPHLELEELHSLIVDGLMKGYESETSIMAQDPEEFRAVENNFRYFFANDVKYLGPLRDEPKPLYPLESLGNTTDVGFKGEHTAAVLDLNRNRSVPTIDVQKFETSGIFVSSYINLGEAVSRWLSFLGVAESVVTADRGKIGHELQVNTADVEKAHDLTNVGVGVSQVLPIVVMALLSGKGSLLIFEQPELHLHPKVQARLGDFFLAMSLLGKQCIVETHSEYLIERFRRRIAEDEDDRYKKLLSVYFFETIDGQTCVRNVEINEYGAILNWPSEFFDQAANETDQIISAAAAKRLRRKNSTS